MTKPAPVSQRGLVIQVEWSAHKVSNPILPLEAHPIGRPRLKRVGFPDIDGPDLLLERTCLPYRHMKPRPRIPQNRLNLEYPRRSVAVVISEVQVLKRRTAFVVHDARKRRSNGLREGQHRPPEPL